MVIHIIYTECGADHKLCYPCVTPQLLFPTRRKSPGTHRTTVAVDLTALYSRRASSPLLDIDTFEFGTDVNCAAAGISTCSYIMSQDFSDTLPLHISSS
jgi:hypothetical protein